MAGLSRYKLISASGSNNGNPAEWWIVQVGAISGKFENMVDYYAVKGDVLYSEPTFFGGSSILLRSLNLKKYCTGPP